MISHCRTEMQHFTNILSHNKLTTISSSWTVITDSSAQNKNKFAQPNAEKFNYILKHLKYFILNF